MARRGRRRHSRDCAVTRACLAADAWAPATATSLRAAATLWPNKTAVRQVKRPRHGGARPLATPHPRSCQTQSWRQTRRLPLLPPLPRQPRRQPGQQRVGAWRHPTAAAGQRGVRRVKCQAAQSRERRRWRRRRTPTAAAVAAPPCENWVPGAVAGRGGATRHLRLLWLHRHAVRVPTPAPPRRRCRPEVVAAVAVRSRRHLLRYLRYPGTVSPSP